jgi:hypothetical protein
MIVDIKDPTRPTIARQIGSPLEGTRNIAFSA